MSDASEQSELERLMLKSFYAAQKFTLVELQRERDDCTGNEQAIAVIDAMIAAVQAYCKMYEVAEF